MEKHAKVVIIGGGVVGCSILYHLSKFGLKDCILIERTNLLQARLGMQRVMFT